MRKNPGKDWGGYPRITGRVAATLAVVAALAIFPSCSKQPKVIVPPDAIIQLSDQFSSDFALTDQKGRAVADEDYRGKVMIVYFGFASCPDVCPMALGNLSAALNDLSDKERTEIVPLFITVDPERDTPEALAAFLSFNDRIVGLTGTPEAAAAARQSFKVYARKEPLPDSALGYSMDHTSLFYLVDRKGRPKLALSDSLNAAELAEMLRRSIKA